ncbi:MAG: CocE/NonD family hydrolase [Verrucomicrobiales bacterium]|nr:CocE/NonD family hydrolase [Verrucomicrobiales bacterium]
MPKRGTLRVCGLLFAGLAGWSLAERSVVAAEAPSQELDADGFAERYTKFEHRIPMRDGVRLHTSVYIPKDDSKAYPMLLIRTPYGVRPYGSSAFADPNGSFETLARDQFIFVFQDVRGRNGSEGEFVHVRPYRPAKSGPTEVDESSDTWDTIDWLVRQVPGSNGKVGMLGISYPGFYVSMGMIDSHPALAAASPQAPIADWFIGDDFHHNGALFLSHAFNFLAGFGQKLEEPTRQDGRPFDHKTPDGYDFFLRMGPLANADRVHFKGAIQFWPELGEHANYDAFWQARNIRPHLKNIRCAVMTVGGWFDAEDLFGALETHRSVVQFNPGIEHHLVMGPWAHGEWGRGSGERLGNVDFQAKTAAFYRENIELPFFRRHLKGDTNTPLPKAYVFETGTHRWRRLDAWPPATVIRTNLFLGPEGRLAAQSPPGVDTAFDEFVSDPTKPVPAIPGIAIGMTREYMTDDQRFASRRPDVLVYVTEPLEEDLTIAGPVEASLVVSTTGTDADWIVKLIDVYHGDFPDPKPNPAGIRMGGYQQLVRGEPMRGRFRKSFEHPEPFTPGKPEPVSWVMPDVFHVFRRGHRIMIQVQSTWFPIIDRNPQTYVDSIWNARPEDFRKATHRVHRGGATASRVTLSVLPRVSL